MKAIRLVCACQHLSTSCPEMDMTPELYWFGQSQPVGEGGQPDLLGPGLLLFLTNISACPGELSSRISDSLRRVLASRGTVPRSEI